MNSEIITFLEDNLKNITLDGGNIGDESKYGKKFLPISKFDINIIMEYFECRIEFLKKRLTKFPEKQEEIDKLQNISKEEILECLQQLEDMYVNNMIQLQDNAIITPMKVQDGKVVISDGMLFHTTGFDSLNGIAVGGIMPTEYFGELESEREGRFCSFIAERNQACLTQKSLPSEGNRRIFIYLDEQNPIMQELSGMDFFMFKELQRTNPELIKERFSDEVIKIFETLIEPLSPAGDMHKGMGMMYDYWKAIPSGIPPLLINGICIQSKEPEFEEKVKQIKEMFPNVTIFDEERNVLYRPEMKREKISIQEIGKVTINTPTTAKVEAEQVENGENTKDNVKEGEEVGDDN